MSKEISLGKSNKFGNIDLSKLKGNIDISKLSDGAKKIANIFDANKNNKLEQSELKNIFDRVREYSKDDNNISKSESKNIFSGLFDSNKKISGDDGLNFLQELSKQADNIESATTNAKGQNVITYKPNENGEVITEIYDGDKIVSKKTTNINDGSNIVENYSNNGEIESRETTDKNFNTKKEMFENGKLKESIEINQHTGETIYKDSSEKITKKEKLISPLEKEVEYYDETGKVTKKERKDSNGGITSSIKFEYDSNGEVKTETVKDAKGSIVTQKSKNDDGSTTVFDAETNTKVTTTPDGSKIVEDLATGNVKNYKTENGTDVFVNLTTIIQNNETPELIAQKFKCDVNELLELNKDIVKKNGNEKYFLAGAEIKLPESVNSKTFEEINKNRKSSQDVEADYNNFIQEQMNEHVKDKQQKTITLDKDYSSMWEFSMDLLKQEGIENPTQAQINDKMQELVTLNGNISPKRGIQITALKTDAEIEVDKRMEELKQLYQEINQQKENHDKNWKEGTEIAENLYNDMKGFRTSRTFDAHIQQITEDNVSAVVLSFRNADRKESLAECIFDERNKHQKDRLSVIQTVFDKLVSKAEELDIETEQYKSDFNEAKSQMDIDNSINHAQNIGELLDNMASTYSYQGFDKAIEGLATAIEAVSDITSAEREEISDTPSIVLMNNTADSLSKVYENAQKSFQDQREEEGTIADFINWVRKVDGSELDPRQVEADIVKYGEQIEGLKQCETEDEFKTKFKDIFGVDYDPVLVEAYREQNNAQLIADAAFYTEQSFNTLMNDVLECEELHDDTILTADYDDEIVTNSAEDKYNKYEKNFRSVIDNLWENDTDGILKKLHPDCENSQQLFDSMMRDKGITSKSTLQEKYNALREITIEFSKNLHNNTELATNGEGYDAFRQKTDRMYTVAFGTENDIAERVAEYNRITQASVEGVKIALKAGVAVLATVATAGTAGIFLASAEAAGIAAGGYMFIEVGDQLGTSNGVTGEEFGEIARDGAKFGFEVGAFNVISRYANGLLNKSGLTGISKATGQVVTNGSVSTVKDAVKGNVTPENVLMNYLMGGSSASVAAKYVKKAMTSEFKAFAPLIFS